MPEDHKPTVVNLRSGVAAGASGGFFDLRPVRLPVVDLTWLDQASRVAQLLTQNVGVAGVPVGLGQDMDHHVEKLDLRLWPPRDMAAGIDRKRLDRRVGVLPRPPVTIDDVSA